MPAPIRRAIWSDSSPRDRWCKRSWLFARTSTARVRCHGFPGSVDKAERWPADPWYKAPVLCRASSATTSGKATTRHRPHRELLDAARVSTPAYVYDIDAIGAATSSLVEAFRHPASRRRLCRESKHGWQRRARGGERRRRRGRGLGRRARSGAGMRNRAERIVMSGVGKLAWEIDLAIGAGHPRDPDRKRGGNPARRSPWQESGQDRRRSPCASTPASTSTPMLTSPRVTTKRSSASCIATFPRALDAISRSAGASVAAPWRFDPRRTRCSKVPIAFLESARVVCVHRERAPKQRAKARASSISAAGSPSITARVPSVPRRLRASGRRLSRPIAGWRPDAPGRAGAGARGAIRRAGHAGHRDQGERARRLRDRRRRHERLDPPRAVWARHRIEPAARGRRAARSGRSWVRSARARTISACTLWATSRRAWVVVRDAGAYGYTMASEYNGRALPAEVFVSAGRVTCVSASPGVERWVHSRLGA